MRLELEMVTVPGADVDRAKAFYVDQVGFHADIDVRTDDDRRFVRLTPPGSACCVAIGEGWIDSAPGSLQGTQLVVEDVDEAPRFACCAWRRSHGGAAVPVGPLLLFLDPGRQRGSVQEPPAAA